MSWILDFLETWTLTKRDESRTEAQETIFLRRVIGSSKLVKIKSVRSKNQVEGTCKTSASKELTSRRRFGRPKKSA